ncbi:hypothetical protein V502_00495 [Pseudogymnoascus sp. VKM F-4520 (FW-2644)]|nr:hypothetical protein V502_00495 [Pseudogymnoascus sp. VKM F-4520 (FW-2644)]
MFYRVHFLLILAGSVPLIPLAGATWLEEIATAPAGAVASWAGDLEKAHVTATNGIADLLETYYGREHSVFAAWNDSPWPTAFSDAEQFYTLRDAVNYVEQWLPGDCLRYPALVGIVGLGVAVDECVIYSKDIGKTSYLGITVSDWEVMVKAEVMRMGGDCRWLDIAFSGLYGCICLQNLEKAMLGGAPGIRTASMDWNTLPGYFTRSEIALTAVTSFFVAAYSGAPYRECDVRPLSVAAASNVVMFDLAKRATGQGGGNITEVDLGGDGGVEIRMRAHLIGRLLSYACDELPSALVWALYRNWESTCVMPLVNDRYVERAGRRRAAVPEAYLKKMDEILRVTGGHVQIPHVGAASSSVAGCREAAGAVQDPESVNLGHTPKAWLTALASHRNRNYMSNNKRNHADAEPIAMGLPAQHFTSLLQVVSNSEGSEVQVLKSIFDGAPYEGRPVGGQQ